MRNNNKENGNSIGIYTGEISPSEFCERNIYPKYVERYLEKYNTADTPFQKYFFVITRIMSTDNLYQISSDMKGFSETDKTIIIHIKYKINKKTVIVPQETCYYSIWKINGEYNNQEVYIFIEPQNKIYKLSDNYLYEKTESELTINKYLGGEE